MKNDEYNEIENIMNHNKFNFKEIENKIKQNKYIKISSLHYIRKILDGLSGSDVLLFNQINEEDKSSQLGILKIAETSKNISDLLNEKKGFHIIQSDKCFEQKIPVFTYSFEINNRYYLYISYVGSFKNDRNKLSDLLNDPDKAIKCIKKINKFYNEIFKTGTSKNNYIYEHYNFIIGDKKQSITDFNWSDYIGKFSDIYEVIFDKYKILNPVLFLNNQNISDYSWIEDMNIFIYKHIHGDLNTNNILLNNKNDFYFIDFEKVRELPVFYDLTFLFMWIIQIRILNGNEIEFHKILKLSDELSNIILNFETKDSSFPEYYDVYKILKKVIKINLENEQTNHKQNSLILCFISASLLRAYYELREIDNFTNKKKYSGLFFYYFSGMLLEKSNFICKKYSINCYNEIIKPKKNIEIKNINNFNKSFIIRYVYEFPIENNLFVKNNTKYWNREINFDISKNKIPFSCFEEKNLIQLYNITKDILFWQPATILNRNIMLPAFYKFNLGLIAGKGLSLFFNKIKAYITSIHFVPLKKTGFLSINIIGENCLMNDFIKYVSGNRNVGKIPISTTDNKKFSFNLNLKNLAGNLENQIRNNFKDCCFSNEFNISFKPIVHLYLTVYNQNITSDYFKKIYEKVATLSPLNSKIKNKSFFWTDSEAIDTLHSIHKRTHEVFSIAVDSSNNFNSEVKLNLFENNYYFLWLLAKICSQYKVKNRNYISSLINQYPRKNIFKYLLDYYDTYYPEMGTVLSYI